MDRFGIKKAIQIINNVANDILAENKYGFAYLLMESHGITVSTVLGDQISADNQPDILNDCIKASEWALDISRACKGKSINEISSTTPPPLEYCGKYSYRGKYSDRICIDHAMDIEKDIVIAISYIYGYEDDLIYGGLSETMALWIKRICNNKQLLNIQSCEEILVT